MKPITENIIEQICTRTQLRNMLSSKLMNWEERVKMNNI